MNETVFTSLQCIKSDNECEFSNVYVNTIIEETVCQFENSSCALATHSIIVRHPKNKPKNSISNVIKQGILDLTQSEEYNSALSGNNDDELCTRADAPSTSPTSSPTPSNLLRSTFLFADDIELNTGFSMICLQEILQQLVLEKLHELNCTLGEILCEFYGIDVDTEILETGNCQESSACALAVHRVSVSYLEDVVSEKRVGETFRKEISHLTNSEEYSSALAANENDGKCAQHRDPLVPPFQ